MDNMDNITIEAFHPGKLFAEEIEERGIARHEACQKLKCKANELDEFIDGNRNISIKTALLIKKWLGPSVEYWINMQIAWNEQEAKKDLKAYLTKPQKEI
jgi:addiction module HigA family antidote